MISTTLGRSAARTLPSVTIGRAWLARRGDDPVLLLAAAKLCIQNHLWGKARSYLESSLALRPVAEGYRVYGQLLEKMGEPDAAAEAFRLAGHKLPFATRFVTRRIAS